MGRRARIAGVLLAALITGCSGGEDAAREEAPMPSRSLDEVQAEHTDSLLALPGVTGIYRSETPDGTPCIKLLVVERTPEVEALPGTLEGHPLVIEETDEIRPLDED